jgi:hypothetical protein
MPEPPDAHIESKAYIQLGDQRIPAQIEYAPIIEDPHVDFNRSLADLWNTTIKFTGTPAGIELFKPLMDDLIEHSTSDMWLMVSRRMHQRLIEQVVKGKRYHRSKLRQRRKHRAMFRRKKRGLA